MKSKKIDMSRKKDFKTLVEDFLERDYSHLETFYQNHRSESLSTFANIFQFLGDPTVDPDDLSPDQLRDTILEWHRLLIPVWKKLRAAFMDYRENVQPEREEHQKMIAMVNDPSSPLSEFRDSISDYTLPSDEKTYAIKLRRSPITINLFFDSGKFSLSLEGIRVVDRFLLQIKDAPIDIFSICGYCGKIIIITREGKRYHAGCASKAKQKELWAKDPEGCREKERNRYHQRVRGE